MCRDRGALKQYIRPGMWGFSPSTLQLHYRHRLKEQGLSWQQWACGWWWLKGQGLTCEVRKECTYRMGKCVCKHFGFGGLGGSEGFEWNFSQVLRHTLFISSPHSLLPVCLEGGAGKCYRVGEVCKEQLLPVSLQLRFNLIMPLCERFMSI